MQDNASDALNGTVEGALYRLGPRLPGSLRHRLFNSLDHFKRADLLFDLDKEMSSFRAITGEEEAATCLMKVMQLRRYPHAGGFNTRDHQHKAALIACIMAVQKSVAPILKEFQLVFDFENVRVDIKIPLANLGVQTPGDYVIQPIEPLGIIHSRNDVNEHNLFDDALAELASGASHDNIKAMIAFQANSRNGLLYASDSTLPRSQLTREGLQQRKIRAMAILVIMVMVYQSRLHLPLVRQATFTFLSVIDRLPTSSPQ